MTYRICLHFNIYRNNFQRDNPCTTKVAHTHKYNLLFFMVFGDSSIHIHNVFLYCTDCIFHRPAPTIPLNQPLTGNCAFLEKEKIQNKKPYKKYFLSLLNNGDTGSVLKSSSQCNTHAITQICVNIKHIQMYTLKQDNITRLIYIYIYIFFNANLHNTIHNHIQ